MPKAIEKILLIAGDFIAINLTFLCWGLLRNKLGYYTEQEFFYNFYLSLLVFFYWFFLFFFFGLYKSWYAQSRFDEFVTVLKTVTIGVFIIFVLTADARIDLKSTPSLSRIIIISYWVMLIFFVGASRILLRTLQRKMLESGIGRRKTLIIGWNQKAQELYDRINEFPALGYDVLGFISRSKTDHNQSYKNGKVLGSYSDVARVVESNKIEEIIISVKNSSSKDVISIISRCDGLPVNLKIVPDLYDIVMGYGRTNQIYGFPLIEILPQMMPQWELRVKRLIDIVISVFVLILLVPFWILVALIIKLESRGPILFAQKRVGKDGKHFTVYKFRSMVQDAEKETGPVWAGEKDPRVTFFGRIIRKLRIDEVPQFFNVLVNDMSLVGPRPERPYFVEKLKREIPLYTRRLRMKPGITGWAQIKGGYDTTIENVKKKLEYDLFYIENVSLRMDLKILFNTIYVMIRGKGQ
ncbi:MAG TPA: undecaprenyl-phosphate glucose phosphotransferase [bacterium]